ncbi:MAG: hypothetical protein LDL41_00340 [Coleofasciculus sp. S288]|nr:hypothetical protein [Coleofasciculus sp. S288]
MGSSLTSPVSYGTVPVIGATLLKFTRLVYRYRGIWLLLTVVEIYRGSHITGVRAGLSD